MIKCAMTNDELISDLKYSGMYGLTLTKPAERVLRSLGVDSLQALSKMKAWDIAAQHYIGKHVANELAQILFFRRLAFADMPEPDVMVPWHLLPPLPIKTKRKPDLSFIDPDAPTG
jgi:hypothetical protein